MEDAEDVNKEDVEDVANKEDVEDAANKEDAAA